MSGLLKRSSNRVLRRRNSGSGAILPTAHGFAFSRQLLTSGPQAIFAAVSPTSRLKVHSIMTQTVRHPGFAGLLSTQAPAKKPLKEKLRPWLMVGVPALFAVVGYAHYMAGAAFRFDRQRLRPGGESLDQCTGFRASGRHRGRGQPAGSQGPGAVSDRPQALPDRGQPCRSAAECGAAAHRRAQGQLPAAAG